MNKKSIITLFLLLVSFAVRAQVQPTTELVGSWSGKLNIGAISLTLVLNLEQAIRSLLPSSKKNLVKEYPSLNHLFQHCTTGHPNEYSQIEETISPEVLQDIAQWIKSLK